MPRGRRDPPALLVFIRGRWQSVPPASRFAVARGGRLEELRSATVRSALRRFQMWLPSKARFGPRLSFKIIPPPDRENSDKNVTLIEPKQLHQQNEDVRPCKRTRDSTSSEEPVQTITTLATVHAVKQSEISKNRQLKMIQLLSSESKSSEESRTNLNEQTHKEMLIKSSKKLSETSRTDLINQKSKEIILSPKKSSVSSRNLLDSPKRSLSLRRKPFEQTNSSKQSSPILKSKDLSEKLISRYLQSRGGKQRKSPKKVEIVLSDSDIETDQTEILKSKTKQNLSPKNIKGISNFEFRKKNEKSSSNNQKKFHKIGPKRQKLDQDTSESESPKKAENIFQRQNETFQTQSKTIGTCKELEIEERDIELLRIFLQKHYSDSVLLKFDAEDEYKRMIFFRINPLVNIEWCPIIDRMLRRSQDNQITLTDFASNLGLRSVTEAASVKTQRYKIRKRTEKSSNSDSSSEDKENNDKMPRRIQKAKVLKEREHNMRESSTGDKKSKESKNKVSDIRVHNRKRTESESEVSNAKENNKKAGSARKRTTKTNQNTIESDSEASYAKANSKNAEIAKERARENHNTVETESEESNAKEKINKQEKAKKRTKPENRITVESESDASNAKANNNKAGFAKERTKRLNHNAVESDSEVSNTTKRDKRDNAKKKTKIDQRNPSASDSQDNNAKRVDRKEIDNTVELSSESEKGEVVKPITKTAKPKPVISSKRRRTNLQHIYSSLEDQAIVAWVSTGSRASRVNGNLLWRQLQDQYTQITGIRRTWHSLRNRYLRYILPKLGDLALPLSQQTRLRAAAATGELKAHKVRSPRRNSIFKLPPRGAASRRPAATNDDTETDNKEVPSKDSPSYSSLTRQFTRRHNLTRPSSELSDNSQRSNKLEVADRKPQAKGNSPKKPFREMNSTRKQINDNPTGNEHSDSDKRNESPRRDIDSNDPSSESEDESKKTNEPRRTRRSVNDANKRMSRSDTRQNTNESERDSSESSSESEDEPPKTNGPRRTRLSVNDANKRMSRSDIRQNTNESERDSSKSSRESEDEPTQTNEPRRTRLSVNDANKRMSRSDTRRNTNESNRRLTRQSNILDESNVTESHKSRGETDKHKSASEKTNESPNLKVNRHKSPSEQSSRDSSESMSRSRRKSPENNRRRSRRITKNRDESDNESKRRALPTRSMSRSPTRKLNRNKSPSEPSSKGSKTSMSQVRRKSKSPVKRKKTRHDSSSEENDSSNGSVSQPRKKLSRINSLKDRSSRRKSNRLITPMKLNGRLTSDSPKRKSNRLTPNESSNKRRHSSESKRKSKLAKRDSLDEIVLSDSSESFETKKPKKDLIKKVDPTKKRVEKQKKRKLFNPKAVL